MKLFTKQINDMLFAQYKFGNDLSKQKVVAKIFNPYGRGVWYLLNSDPNDPDYIWAIVNITDVEIGSVSRTELESLKVPPFRLPLERDSSFSPLPAMEVYNGAKGGKRFEKGGEIDDENLEMLQNISHAITHHSKELSDVLKHVDSAEPWVITKANRASTDLSDITHYLEGQASKMADGGMMEDGGMMARGGQSEKPMSYYKYETPMVSIYWNGKRQPLGMFKSAEEAYEIVKEQRAIYGDMGSYEIRTPDKVIKLEDGGVMEDGGMMEDGDMMAKGGVIKLFDRDNSRGLTPYNSIPPEILDKVALHKYLKFAGNFGVKDWKQDGYLYFLDEYDKYLVENIDVKPQERIYRYLSYASAIGGLMPLIKINQENGLLYFSLSDSEGNFIGFERKGVYSQYINLIKVDEDDYYAEGGVTGSVDSLTDTLLSQKIHIFLDKVQPYKYYYVDDILNRLIVGFDENYTQEDADKFVKEAKSSREYFDADSVMMQYMPLKGVSEFSIKLKKAVGYANGGMMADGGLVGGLNADEAIYLFVKKSIVQKYREGFLKPARLWNTDKGKEVEKSLIKKGYLNSAGAINELGKNKFKAVDAELGNIIDNEYRSGYYAAANYKKIVEKFENFGKMQNGGMMPQSGNYLVLYYKSLVTSGGKMEQLRDTIKLSGSLDDVIEKVKTALGSQNYDNASIIDHAKNTIKAKVKKDGQVMKYEDGGMMADGGDTHVGGWEKFLQTQMDKVTHYNVTMWGQMENKEGWMHQNTLNARVKSTDEKEAEKLGRIEFKKKYPNDKIKKISSKADFSASFPEKPRPHSSGMMEDGGMMAKGGKIDSDVFDKLKKGDKIKITRAEGTQRSKDIRLLVKNKTIVGKGKTWESEKITFVNLGNPNGVNYFAYKRANGTISFAIGDLAISDVRIVDDGDTALGSMMAKGGSLNGKDSFLFKVTESEKIESLKGNKKMKL